MNGKFIEKINGIFPSKITFLCLHILNGINIFLSELRGLFQTHFLVYKEKGRVGLYNNWHNKNSKITAKFSIGWLELTFFS